jgi:hypothetical protein
MVSVLSSFCERFLLFWNVWPLCFPRKKTELLEFKVHPWPGRVSVQQGCQIFLGTIYQSGGKSIPNDYKITKSPQNLPNGRKIFQMTRICNSISRSSQIYQNWDFWSEKKPSGNPGVQLVGQSTFISFWTSFQRFTWKSFFQSLHLALALSLSLSPGLPDFSWSKHTKLGKI